MGFSPSGNSYGRKWQKLRGWFIVNHPLCEMCSKVGRDKAAEVVDHIKPHKGNVELLYDVDNLQSLCKTCHDSVKQAQDRNGWLRGADVMGFPLDKNHGWKK